jgi:ribosomal protein S18 acetylase RimI-like enzyme
MTPESPSTITYRPGTAEDSYAVFLVFEHALADLLRRMGHDAPTSIADPAELAAMWDERRGLYDHLALTAEQFWVAEADGAIVGFARAVLRDGVRELTELFVLPTVQARGVGRELLRRTFPAEGARVRSVIASPDMRAQALYLRSGMHVAGTLYYWQRKPEAVEFATDLRIEAGDASPTMLDALAVIDRMILGYVRPEDHGWLLSDRQGLLYYRGDAVVGYGYYGRRSGPFALLDPADFPAVLAHAETQVAGMGHSHFGLEIPMANRHAVEHLLARGFQIEALVATLLADKPFGRFDRYVVTGPPFFL